MSPSPCCAEGDGLQELELGAFTDAGVPQRLLFLQSGSLLILTNLNLTGVASPAVGKVGLPTGIDAFPGFLAIGGEPGSSVRSARRLRPADASAIQLCRLSHAAAHQSGTVKKHPSHKLKLS